MSILGGLWWFLTSYLEDRTILYVMDHHDIWILTCMPNFSFLAWLEVCQEPPVLDVHTWRTLMVPDQLLGGQSHPGHHGSSWYMNLDLCAKFQLASMIRIVPRFPCHWWLYLEDVDGFWPGTWRIWSSMTSSVISICDSWLLCKISAL